MTCQCTALNDWSCGSSPEVCAHIRSNRSINDLRCITEAITRIEAEANLKGFHFFLSHAQATGADKVARIFDWWKRWGYECWRDADQVLRNLDEMVKGTYSSSVFVHLINKGSLLRQYCLIEARAAMQLGKPCVCFREDDPRHVGYISLDDARAECPEDLRRYIFGQQVWPIGSTPGGVMEEHLYGPHLMQVVNHAWTLQRSTAIGSKSIKECLAKHK